jgi:acyl-CoA reductase-like NAD-dependent aldehyde dehydrogenase
VWRTPKLFVGGKFVRSESGQTMAVEGPMGVVHASRASRKDLRDAVEVARAAVGPWGARTAANRGQILYRLAEMLEMRVDRWPDAAAAADRAVHHAGWADKVTAVLSSLNPVAATYVNYSMVRPMGVVVALVDPATGLLGMVEAAAAIAVMGNAGIVAVAASVAEAATHFMEALATSDLPGGVINVLTGDLDEIAANLGRQDDVDALLLVGRPLGDEALTAAIAQGARVIRRVVTHPDPTVPLGPDGLGQLAELKTVWMSAYEPVGGASTY